MTDFIKTTENFLIDSECLEFISLFEKMSSMNLTHQRLDYSPNIGAIEKQDESFNMVTSQTVALKGFTEQVGQLTSRIWKEYESYSSDYPSLRMFKNQLIENIKIQKTLPGQGYHIWHFENSSIQNAKRCLAWMIYLNDVEEGGETEFLYLRKRIKPKAGTFVMWPAGFTHTHRGNSPLTNEKYILTGWIESYQ